MLSLSRVCGQVASLASFLTSGEILRSCHFFFSLLSAVFVVSILSNLVRAGGGLRAHSVQTPATQVGTLRSRVTWVIACPRSHIKISNRASTRLLTPKFLFFSCSLIRLLWLSLCLSMDQQSLRGFTPFRICLHLVQAKAASWLGSDNNWTRLGLLQDLWAKSWGPGGRPGSKRKSKPALCPRSA